MKRTVIKYLPDRKTGTVKILEITNAADAMNLSKKCGDKVAQEYMNQYPYYLSYGFNGSIQLRRNRGDINPNDILKPDLIMPKEQFSEIIAALKAAGNRLSEIIKANPPEPQEKTIII